MKLSPTNIKIDLYKIWTLWINFSGLAPIYLLLYTMLNFFQGKKLIVEDTPIVSINLEKLCKVYERVKSKIRKTIIWHFSSS